MAAMSGAIFPSDVLRNALKSPVSIELKNGVTYNGKLMSVDKWMNADLHDVISTSADGVRFFKHREVCVRGNAIRSVRVVAEAFDPPKRAADPRKGADRPVMSKEERARKYARKEGGGGGGGGGSAGAPKGQPPK